MTRAKKTPKAVPVADVPKTVEIYSPLLKQIEQFLRYGVARSSGSYALAQIPDGFAVAEDTPALIAAWRALRGALILPGESEAALESAYRLAAEAVRWYDGRFAAPDLTDHSVTGEAIVGLGETLIELGHGLCAKKTLALV